jgi:hypothetical protein
MMNQKKQSSEAAVREIRRRTRRRFSREEKILIVLEGLRGEPPRFIVLRNQTLPFIDAISPRRQPAEKRRLT